MVGRGPAPTEALDVAITGPPSVLAGLWGPSSEKPLIHTPCGVEMLILGIEEGD